MIFIIKIIFFDYNKYKPESKKVFNKIQKRLCVTLTPQRC